MSEGYAEGKILARKFMILYRLSEALLSAQVRPAKSSCGVLGFKLCVREVHASVRQKFVHG